jgi:hypothetical protein
VSISVSSNIKSVIADMGRIKREVVDEALPRALNRVIDMARTQTARNLVSDGYNFKVGQIKGAIKLVQASRGMRGVRMRVPRQTKSLMEFNPTQTRAGVAVKVHGGKKLIKGAFIGQLQNGRYGVYIEDKGAGKLILRHKKDYKKGSRGGWHAVPVRKLYGPSIGGSFVNQRLMQALDQFVGEKFEERLTHEIKRITR